MEEQLNPFIRKGLKGRHTMGFASPTVGEEDAPPPPPTPTGTGTGGGAVVTGSV